ncbi:MAG TPA: hypothetical protein V6C97_17995 [Oculatellaceae cyanobacterium]
MNDAPQPNKLEQNLDNQRQTGGERSLVPSELNSRHGLTPRAEQPSVMQGRELVFSDIPGFEKREAKFSRTDTSESGAGRIKDGADRPDATIGGTVEHYSQTLERAGYSSSEAKELAQQTYERFNKTENLDIKDSSDNHLKGTPADQLHRLDKAAQNILDRSGVLRDTNGAPTGLLGDGQRDHLTDSDRKNLVLDMANRYADPKENVVQGKHNTCALESMQKQSIQGGDPAALAEAVASTVNTGKAQLHDRDGNTRTVAVDSRSLMPDAESRRSYQRDFGRNDVRGEFGQACDALMGQVMADRKSERLGQPSSAQGLENATFKYMAAHATAIDGNMKTQSGEGLLQKGNDGRYHAALSEGPDGLMHHTDSPGASMWDVADTNRAMGGADGSVFVHRNFAGNEAPPPGQGYPQDLRVTTFSSNQELQQKLSSFETANGQSAQLLVDAPYLPGGGQTGHGLHVLNVSMNKDGDAYNIDNNWSEGKDLSNVAYSAIARATDPANWQLEQRPTVDTIIRPGDDSSMGYTVGGDKHSTERDTAEKKREEHERVEREREKAEKERRKEEEARKAELIEEQDLRVA